MCQGTWNYCANSANKGRTVGSLSYLLFQLEEELRQSNVATTSEPQKRRRKESHVSPDTLQKWLAKQVNPFSQL